MSHSHFDIESHRAQSPFLAFGFRLTASCHTGQIFPLQTQLVHAPACWTDHSSPLLPITHSTWAKKRISSMLRYCVWWGQCASSCCLNPCCQEGGQRSLRAELRWDYELFDLACFAVVPCLLSHSIILYLSSTGYAGCKGLSTNKFKCRGLAALVRMLHNKGISGNPCGFEDWWPKCCGYCKIQTKKTLFNIKGAL